MESQKSLSGPAGKKNMSCMVKTWAQTLVGSGKTERGGNAKEGWNWEI